MCAVRMGSSRTMSTTFVCNVPFAYLSEPNLTCPDEDLPAPARAAAPSHGGGAPLPRTRPLLGGRPPSPEEPGSRLDH